MEDTKSLLIMVLQKIFHSRLNIVEDTYQLIYNYNNGKKEKKEYERTLKNICDLMNEELPSDILVYLLTLVDMPNEDGIQLPIMEKIQKTYCCLAESVRPFLLEYLTNKKSGDDNLKGKDDTTNENVKTNVSENAVKAMLERDQESAKSLLDIAANYVIKNEKKLKYIYKSKLIQAWKMINSNYCSGDTLKQCYNTLEHINKKTKLLRSIENDNVVSVEEYENSDILLKECNMLSTINSNPFQLNEFLVEKLKSI
ncbi:uncharacterized protein LOC108914302, partial [Anoplophora glabripennis]|uniref:uncharacterized protein LOC108914302 n=1 Tax=Anoplophora glabripennis TaxID=217634 RepID=UPI000C767710